MSLLVNIAFVVLGALIGIASVHVGPFKGKQDNIIEELSEEVIRERTGYKIDLSPETEEEDDE